MNALYLQRSYMVLNDVGRFPTAYCEHYSDVIRPNLPNCLNAIESLESKHASTGPACSSVLRTSLLPAPAVHIVTFTPFTDTQIQYTLYTGPSALLLSLLLPLRKFLESSEGVTSVPVYLFGYFCFGEFYLHWAKISFFILIKGLPIHACLYFCCRSATAQCCTTMLFWGLPIPVGLIFLLQKRHCACSYATP